MWLNKRKIRETLNTEEKANNYMDNIVSHLSNYDIKRCFISAKEKYERKPNKNTLYMMNYFKSKLDDRNIKL